MQQMGWIAVKPPTLCELTYDEHDQLERGLKVITSYRFCKTMIETDADGNIYAYIKKKDLAMYNYFGNSADNNHYNRKRDNGHPPSNPTTA